jgi:hypothetical protein
MIFASHIHGYYIGTWGKTPYIITGGAGAEMLGTDPRHYFYHYLKVNITNDGVKYQVVKIKSPDFEFIDRLIHDAWIYADSFFAIHFLDLILLFGVGYLGFFIAVKFKKNKRKNSRCH